MGATALLIVNKTKVISGNRKVVKLIDLFAYSNIFISMMHIHMQQQSLKGIIKVIYVVMYIHIHAAHTYSRHVNTWENILYF